MSLLKPVTPEEAKRVWVSIPNPSARRVAKALTQSGRRVHHSTIARWRAQDWRPVAHSLHPLDAATQEIDRAAGDGGISGGTMERPALQVLMTDIRSRKIDVVVVYKADRLRPSMVAW